jgi:hypothetical protein
MTNGHTVSYSVIGVSLLALASLASSGCSTEPKRVEADYGNSVTQMVQAATYNPEAAASTESIPVMGMDGKRAMRTLDAMQAESMERPKDFDDIIDIDLGDN